MDRESGVVEKPAKTSGGMAALLLNILAMIAATVAIIIGTILSAEPLGISAVIIGSLYVCLIGPILFGGLKILKPNEALVLTLFGRYYGSLRGPGFFFVNPFVTAAKPNAGKLSSGATSGEGEAKLAVQAVTHTRVSLKALTLNNSKQKINDSLGNPVIIGIVVVWRVVDTAKALFSVDNYIEFLSIQADSALRNIVRLYPYDSTDAECETSLRGSSQLIAEKLKEEIQTKVDLAGLEIMEARITHLSYAPEIASAMLQRQQATAIIAARQMIVEGAVGMVEMALERLSANKVVELDEERKAAMVSNLLVVLCGNKDAQPVVNSGSLY